MIVSRVKLYQNYRKSLQKLDNLENIDYEPKHLEPVLVHEKIEKEVIYLNKYEKNRLLFNRYYFRRKIIYYSCALLISIALIVLTIIVGIYVFK